MAKRAGLRRGPVLLVTRAEPESQAGDRQARQSGQHVCSDHDAGPGGGLGPTM